MKVSSTSEFIEKLQTFELLYGVGAIVSISRYGNGNRTKEYQLDIKDNYNIIHSINISSIDDNELFSKEVK